MIGIVGLAGVLLLQGPPGDTPRRVVASAFAAVEGDSVIPVESAWGRRASRDSGDRAARLGLATLARLTYRYQRADSLYLSLESGDDGYGLYARLGRIWGDLFRTPFDATAARALDLARTARATGDSALTAEALAVAGFLRSRLGALEAALDTLAVAERMVPSAEAWLRPLILCTRAPILSFAGSRDARATALRGLELAKQTGWRRGMALCYSNVSVVTVNDSDDPTLPEAYADSAEAVELATRDSVMLSLTTYNRGYTRWAYADLAGSRRALSESVRQAGATDCIFAMAWSTRWLSAIHWQAGDLASALRDFSLADSLFRRINDGFGLGNIHNGKGIGLLAAGRLDEAETIFRQGLASSLQRGLAEGVYTYQVNLASVRSARGDWLGARKSLEDAIAYGRSHGHQGFTTSLGYNLGIVALRLGELDRAESSFRAFDRTTAPSQYFDRFAVRVRLAEVAARRGDLDRTVRGMEEAARQLDSARNALDDQQLKLMVFQTRSAFDEPDLGLAPIAELLVQGGRASDAFRLAEQRRARTLADRLLRDAFLRGGPVPHPEPSGLVDLAGLRARLPRGTAVVEYLTGRRLQRTIAFIVTSDSVLGVVLPPADSLAEGLDRFIAATEHGNAGGELGRSIAGALFAPVLTALPAGVTSLILVPDGRLHRLPFDALPQPDGTPLLEHFIVSRAPSAVIALQLLPHSRHDGPSRLLALGDPRFAGEVRSNDPETETYRSGYSETGGLARLTGSSAEARSVARYSSEAVVRLRDQASEAYLKTPAVDSFEIIHLATHALVDDQSPGRSSLALTPGQGEDGFLGASELGELHLSADLVVLSACRTAGGALIGGEGVQGLTAPLLAAGARAVVATLWPIGDRRTRALVEDLYRNLAAGQAVGEALQQAKLSARVRGEPPAVWAAFTLVGDPEVRLQLITPPPRWPAWLVGGLALAAIILLLRRLTGRAPRPGSVN